MVQDDLSPSDVPLEGGSNHPLAATHVIHSVPGRVRLRVPALKADSHLAGGLQALLSAQAGVTEVTVAPVCQSVTVVHDPAQWTSKSLCLFLQSRNREELEQCASASLPEAAASSFAMTWLQPWRYLTAAESSPDSKGVLQTAGSVKPGYWMVGYASMVVGVAMFAVPGVPGVPFLILSTYCFSKATIFKADDVSEAGKQVPKAGQ
jgi:Heavy metal associated domain 2